MEPSNNFTLVQPDGTGITVNVQPSSTVNPNINEIKRSASIAPSPNSPNLQPTPLRPYDTKVVPLTTMLQSRPQDLHTFSSISFVHRHSHQPLTETLLQQSNTLQLNDNTIMTKLKDRLTYQQLLQGMLLTDNGEKIMKINISNSETTDQSLHFSSLNYTLVDHNNIEISNSIVYKPAGHMVITNQRVLLCCAELNKSMSLQYIPIVNGKSSELGHYELSNTTSDNLWYFPIPFMN
jgi:hypothetical protein